MIQSTKLKSQKFVLHSANGLDAYSIQFKLHRGKIKMYLIVNFKYATVSSLLYSGIE